MKPYIGRFAPSPTGDLHAGSLACALASWLDARAHRGTWIIRIENIDPPREKPHAIEHQLQLLDLLELHSDEPILYQSDRLDAYAETFEWLKQKGFAYGCACSRKEIAEKQAAHGLQPGVYPGTCRCGTRGRPVRAWRFRVDDEERGFIDRWDEIQYQQNLEKDVGDFVLKRADGFWAYQLAVVVDDGFQKVTHVVRGADLLDNTPRQIALQEALGLSTPEYMHIPLVLASDGEKLSKQNGAVPVCIDRLDEEVLSAWKHLGFEPFPFKSLKDFYCKATLEWKKRFSI